MKRLYGLIGYPLTHSFSKNYFDKKFEFEHITGIEYRNFPLSQISNLPGLIRDNTNLYGLNITIPYKETVIPLLDELDFEAEKVGAVNTIKVVREKGSIFLKGFNTDVYGFRRTLLEKWNQKCNKALILGSGGASKAVCYVLSELGIRTMVVSRKKKGDNFISYKELTRSHIQESLLIVNTTPMGMFPDIDEYPPIPYEYLLEKHFLYDLIYNPEITKFLAFGKERGAFTMNGYKMLVEQAERSWSIWGKSEGNDA